MTRSPVAVGAVVGAALAALIAAIILRSSGSDERPVVADRFERDPAAEEGAPTTTTIPPLDLGPVDPEVQEVAGELQAYVAAARGREFAHDVEVHLLDAAAFEELVDQVFVIDPAEAAAAGALYEALGLIPEGTAAQFAEQLRQHYRSVLGFYAQDHDVVVVRGGELDAGVRAVLVHELVHALDDQWFDLSRPEYDTDRSTERAVTFDMVGEGDATRIEDRWIAEQPADVQAVARAHVGAPAGDLPNDFADFLDYGFRSPYLAGATFVTGVAARGGEGLVDAVLLDPPETTEQVLFPEVFQRRETRLRVPPPPADGEVVDQGVIGALFWMGLLGFAGSGVPADVADAAVAGWGGDWQVSWIEGDQMCTRLDVVGDTATDSAELLDALTRWAADRPEVSVTATSTGARTEVCYQVPVTGPAGERA